MKYTILLKEVGDKRSFKEIITEAQEKHLKTTGDSNIAAVDIDLEEIPANQTAYMLGYLLLSTQDKYLVPCGMLITDPKENITSPLPFEMWDTMWHPQQEDKITDKVKAVSILIQWSLHLENLMRSWAATINPDNKDKHIAALKANRSQINKFLNTSVLEFVVEGKKVTQLLDMGIRFEDQTVYKWDEISVADIANMFINAAKGIPTLMEQVPGQPEQPESTETDQK